MIVTTGGLSTRSLAASSCSGSSGSSSAALTISTFWSRAAARAVTVSSVSVCVSVAISPSSISFLITSALPRPSVSATSRTVAPEWTLVGGSSTTSTGFSWGSSSSGLRRRPPRRRGGRDGGACGMCSRRDACESITTRRRLRPPAWGWLSPAARVARAVPDLAGAAGFPSGSCDAALAFDSSVGVAFAAASPAWAPSPVAAARALSASSSSTLEAATLASTPAAFNAARTCLLVRPSCLAISWTRFFKIPWDRVPRNPRLRLWIPRGTWPQQAPFPLAVPHRRGPPRRRSAPRPPRSLRLQTRA